MLLKYGGFILTKFLRALVIGLLVFNFQITFSEEATFSLEDELSEENFETLGLRKLSANELRELSKWIENYKTYPNFEGVTADIEEDYFLVSAIDGNFEGWSGSTIFRLKNGQIWQQRLSGKWKYNKQLPNVRIKKNFFGYFVMRVDDRKSIGVKRIK